MLKLSKTSWIILLIGIFFVAFAGLGLTRSQQFQEQGQLDEELGIAENRLSAFQVKDLGQKHDELRGRLDENLAQLTVVKDSLRQSVESVDVTDEFFKIAQYCGVEVASISSSNIKSDELEDVLCSAITLSALVEGDVPNLINFIIKLNKDYTTGVVESTRIAISENASESISSASIQMEVYSFEGD
ncbi:hypothetical protein ACFLWU_02630 [Chloroflexota bacterium]